MRALPILTKHNWRLKMMEARRFHLNVSKLSPRPVEAHHQKLQLHHPQWRFHHFSLPNCHLQIRRLIFLRNQKLALLQRNHMYPKVKTIPPKRGILLQIQNILSSINQPEKASDWQNLSSQLCSLTILNLIRKSTFNGFYGLFRKHLLGYLLIK